MTLKKKRIGIFFIPILILLSATACSLPGVSQSAEIIITSTPPVVEVQDLSPFQNIGCDWQTDNYAVCNQDSIPKKMGCDTLTTPPAFVSFLDIESDFVTCTYAPQLQTPPDETEAKGLYDSGCKLQVKQRLLAYLNGDYLLIRNLEDLKYHFAPITTAEQALGYAIAATGSQARYDLENLKGYRILTDNLQETNVQVVNDGFEVILYQYQACGCGPHTTDMQTVKVTNSGDIQVLETIPAFENPEEDNLCID